MKIEILFELQIKNVIKSSISDKQKNEDINKKLLE